MALRPVKNSISIRLAGAEGVGGDKGIGPAGSERSLGRRFLSQGASMSSPSPVRATEGQTHLNSIYQFRFSVLKSRAIKLTTRE